MVAYHYHSDNHFMRLMVSTLFEKKGERTEFWFSILLALL